MNYKIRSDFCKWSEGVTEEAWTSRAKETSMGVHSKSCLRLSLHNMLLTAGQEYTKHAARSRPCPRNLQPNTGKLEARTSPGEEGKCVCNRKEEKSNKHSCESKKVDGGLWKIGSDWPTGDGTEKGQPDGTAKARGDRN